jgi:hypothetical protein
MSDGRHYKRGLGRRRTTKKKQRRDARRACDPSVRFEAHVGSAADKRGRLKAQLELLAREHQAGKLSDESARLADGLLYAACRPEVMAPFWERVKKRCPGMSGLTIADLEWFGPKWDWLRVLGLALWQTGFTGIMAELVKPESVAIDDVPDRYRKMLPCVNGWRAMALWMALGGPAAAAMRRVWVAKGNGKKRAIDIAEAWDAVMEHAIKFVIEALLTIGLPKSVVGYRRGLSTAHALAMAIAQSNARNHHVWLVADLVDAFGSVSHPRLRDLLHRRVPCEELVEAIMHFMRPDRREDGKTTGTPRGLAQGSPLSPLLYNSYTAHYLDRPWHRRQPDCPMIRYADDMLVLAPSKREARRAHRALRQLAQSAGSGLQKDKTRIVNMDNGSVIWLGHEIKRRDGKYIVSVPPKKWRAVEQSIRACGHGKDGHEDEDDSSSRLDSIVRNFLAYHGPAWVSQLPKAAVTRLEGIIDDAGLSGPPREVARRRKMAIKAAHKARGKWCRYLEAARQETAPQTEASTNANANALDPPAVAEAAANRTAVTLAANPETHGHMEETGKDEESIARTGSRSGFRPADRPHSLGTRLASPASSSSCSLEARKAYRGGCAVREAPPHQETISNRGGQPGLQGPASKPDGHVASWFVSRRQRARHARLALLQCGPRARGPPGLRQAVHQSVVRSWLQVVLNIRNT